MAEILGKRKRTGVAGTRGFMGKAIEESGTSEMDAQDLFRRFFEAKFKPLPMMRKVAKVIDIQEDDSEDMSDWDGISEDGQAAVQVVEHTDSLSQMALMSKEELKVFMVRRSRSIIRGFH